MAPAEKPQLTPSIFERKPSEHRQYLSRAEVVNSVARAPRPDSSAFDKREVLPLPCSVSVLTRRVSAGGQLVYEIAGL